MIQQQRENAERNVDQKIEDISGRLQQMKDELSGTSAGLQGQIDEVDRAMRAAFEGIGASLPPRRIALRSGTTVGTTVASAITLSFCSTSSGIVKQRSYGQATSTVPMIGKKSLIRWWSVI